MTSVKSLIEKYKSEAVAEIQLMIDEQTGEGLTDIPSAIHLPWDRLTTATFDRKEWQQTFSLEKVRIGEFHHAALSQAVYSGISFPVFATLKTSGFFIKKSVKINALNKDSFLQAFVLRLLCTIPPGNGIVHLIDLQTKGRAFSKLAGLDHKIAPEIPVTPEEVTELLKQLEKRIVEINRKCLRKHEWLSEFNQQNPEEAESYHIVCFSDLNEGLDEESLKTVDRLLEKECAARAGIYLLGACNQLPKKTEDLSQLLEKSTSSRSHPLYSYSIDNLPSHSDSLVSWLNLGLKTLSKGRRIHITLEENRIWTEDASRGVSIPIGKQGIEEVFFTLGNDDKIHALVGGGTGSGKTILLHNIIINGAKLYSPEDLQFLLLDFKEGTGFSCYKNLPHMRVLSTASELHFGKNALEWLVKEKIRRSRLFKSVSATDHNEYIARTGKKLPRLLVIMDEFQQLLSDKNVGFQSSALMDEIVRTGRSYGINLILSTQSLINVNMEGSTLSQLVVRICMKMTETECIKFLDYDNVAPSTFSTPGQAVYNEEAGKRVGNKLFQVAFQDTQEIVRQSARLREIETERYGGRVIQKPAILSGGEAMDASRIPEIHPSDPLVAYLGEPMEIDASPIQVKFNQMDGANLLVVSSSMEVIDIISFNLVSQFSANVTRPLISIFDGRPLATVRWEEWISKEAVALAVKPAEVEPQLNNFIQELEDRRNRSHDENFRPWILFLIDPQGLKSFPIDSTGGSSQAALQVSTLLSEGPRYGIHVIVLTTKYSRTQNVFSSLHPGLFGARILCRSSETMALTFNKDTNLLTEYSGLYTDDSTNEDVLFIIYDKKP